MRYYPASTKLLERAKAVTPLGTQTRSKASTSHVEGAAPAFAVSGRGCRFTDPDGHEFIDYSMALGAVGLGYCHPEIDEAVREQVGRGASFSLATSLEADVADSLCEIVPCAKRVRFVKTGSEATEAAMRIARITTGRDVVLSVGYHGWHSIHDAAKAVHPGVPHRITETIIDVPYNDLHALSLAFEAVNGNVAGVLIEPVLHDAPTPGYLEGVRMMADRYGTVLIFDEVVTGFRWALGGAQEYFKVVPDLACFGKAMGNGYPIAAVVGRADLMDVGAPYVSGTFGGEAVSLAAAKATITVYRRDRVIDHLWSTGRRLQAGLNDAAAIWSAGMPLSCVGYPIKPVIRCVPARPSITGWESPTLEQQRTLVSIFLQACADNGVFFHSTSNNVSFAHTEQDIDTTLVAASAAFGTCLEAISEDAPETFLRGPAYRTLFDRVSTP